MTEYNGIKVGDLITTYWKGYFELVRIIPRYKIDNLSFPIYEYREGAKPYRPVFVFVQKYNSDGKPHESKVERECDARHCQLAQNYIKKELLKINQTCNRLIEIFNTNEIK